MAGQVSARHKKNRNAHLEHLAKEAIEATYGDPAQVACLRSLLKPSLPVVGPVTNRQRKSSQR